MYPQTWQDIIHDRLVKQERNPNMYRHYKGGIYLVLYLANHSETQEKMVVYQKISDFGTGDQIIWVRPYSMFVENVEVDGEIMPRFQQMFTI